MHKDLRGTHLSKKAFDNNEISTTLGDPHAYYEWDTGMGIGRFLQGLKEGRIWGTHCDTCKRTVTPPRVFCELCFSKNITWRELKTTGTVNTFSLCYVNWDATLIKEPHISAVIEVDGTSPRVGFLHLLNEVDPQKVCIGMKVEAVFKDEKERMGDITDIKYWRPL